MTVRNMDSQTVTSSGTLAEYVVHPATWLHKLSDTTDWGIGALIEPMSIALSALRRANLQLGQVRIG